MPVSFAAFGTDLFFVITGFLTVYVTFGKTLTFKDFMFRRLARLAPLYWLFTFLMLLTLFLAPRLLHSTTFNPWHVLTSICIPAIPSSRHHTPAAALGFRLGLELFHPSICRVRCLSLSSNG